MKRRRSNRQKRRQRLLLLLLGGRIHSIPCRTILYRFSTRMIWRKVWIEERTLGRMDTSEKYMIILFTTTPNHHPSKMDDRPKSFLKINLAAKRLVRHSSTSPNQKRRPLPSLLSFSSSRVVRLLNFSFFVTFWPWYSRRLKLWCNIDKL